MEETMKKLFIAALLCATTLPAFASPTQHRSFLPIGKALVTTLKNDHGYSDADIVEFVKGLNRLTVFADHENPKKPEELDDPTKPKVFYLAPYFQPSLDREVVGDNVVALRALDVGMNIDELVDVFSFRLKELRELNKSLKIRNKELDKAKKSLGKAMKANPKDEGYIKYLKEAIQEAKIEIQELAQKIEKMIREGSEVYKDVDEDLQKEIIGQILYNLAKLGVAPTDQQRGRLNSDNPLLVLGTVAELRLDASTGQFGVRNVVVESGLTEEQQNMLSLYKSLRQDVQLKTLPVNKVYVKATAQTSENRTDKVRGGMTIRDINRSSEDENERGLCGSVASCIVTIEYTERGAEISVATGVNSVFLPVVFTGDANVALPDFKGKFDCKFKNGWWAKGRSDVKDGAIIYDGDVYNRIHYKAIDKMEFCDITTEGGHAGAASYMVLMKLHEIYNQMFHQRTIRSENDMEAYRAKVTKEVDYHAKNSQKNKGGYIQYIQAWARGTMGGWQAAVVGIISAARDFYWHTRIEDTSVTKEVEIHQTIEQKGLTKTLEFAFDGFPAICHKRSVGSIEPVAVACSGEIKSSWNNEIGNQEKVCDTFSSRECKSHLKEMAEPNEDGYLVLD